MLLVAVLAGIALTIWGGIVWGVQDDRARRIAIGLGVFPDGYGDDGDGCPDAVDGPEPDRRIEG